MTMGNGGKYEEKPIWQKRPEEGPPIPTVCEKTEAAVPRLYARRWLMLAMFICLSVTNAFQWMEFAIIADIIQMYYEVTPEAVDWTSMIYMVTYIPFIFPAAWLLDRYGLRVVALLGAFGNGLGAWIKCGAAKPHLFPVAFLGQAIVGTSQIFILGLPTRLAAVWFGPNEVSTACAMGVFGNQLGIAFGFLVPPLLVPSNATLEETGVGLRNLYFLSGGLNSAIFLAVLLFFKDRPPTPPSSAQLAAIEATMERNFIGSLKSLVLNFNFILLIVTYGMNVGVFYAVSTLLNQMLIPLFPGKGIQIGQIGLLIVLAGMVGSIISGIWLDKTKRFKQTTFIVYVLSFVGMVIFTFTMNLGKLWVVFLCAGLLGFFMTGYLPIGFEFGVEITYPVSEGTVSGLLNVSCQIFGMLETLIMGALMKRLSTLACNLACCGVLLVGSVLTLFIKSDLRRQNAGRADENLKVKLVEMDEINGNMVKVPIHPHHLPHSQSTLPIMLDNDDQEGEEDIANTFSKGKLVTTATQYAPLVTTGTQYDPPDFSVQESTQGVSSGKNGILKNSQKAQRMKQDFFSDDFAPNSETVDRSVVGVDKLSSGRQLMSTAEPIEEML